MLLHNAVIHLIALFVVPQAVDFGSGVCDSGEHKGDGCE